MHFEDEASVLDSRKLGICVLFRGRKQNASGVFFKSSPQVILSASFLLEAAA